MHMEMIEIEAFVTIAESGTFTRAAEALHCSQPAISRRIELLERELGAPLFERIHSGVRLTDRDAVSACLPGQPDKALEQTLARQQRWLDERSVVPPARP